MRSFLITVVLGVAVAAAAAWWLNLLPITGEKGIFDSDTNEPKDSEVASLGPRLYEALKIDAGLPNKSRLGPDTIMIDNCHLVVVEKQEVPSVREGPLLFVGKQIFQEDPKQPGLNKIVPIDIGEKKITRYITYQPWHVGDLVEAGGMLAMVDPSMALNEVSNAESALEVAKGELEVAKKTKDEAFNQYKTAESLAIKVAIPEESFRLKELTYQRHLADVDAKSKAVEQAKFKVNQARILLNQHYIRNGMTGVGIIKQIYKHRKEAVKSMEPIMEIYNIDKLRAEGMIDASFSKYLTRNMPVHLEPHEEQTKWKKLEGPLGDINSVSVTGDEKTPYAVSRLDPGTEGVQIVAGSEDGKIYIWSLTNNFPKSMIPHTDREKGIPTPVRVVLCHFDRKKNRNWCLSGCADGTIRLWDLNNPEKDPIWQKNQAEMNIPAAISALAISPSINSSDGKYYFASGSEDNNICIWELESGKLLYTFDAQHGVKEPHQGPITSLNFTPQAQLVSASRDNTLRVWNLHEKGAKLVRIVPNRSGTVAQLDVDPLGRYMIYDKGRSLQLLTIKDARPVGFLHNPAGATSFETLALLSPNSSLMLTAGGPEGRLQLWQTPENTRAMEVRQFVPDQRTTISCAAFAPNNDFVVSGCEEGHLYVWSLPSRQDVENHPIRNLKLDLVDTSLQSQQIRIGVTVDNPQNEDYPNNRRLLPGQSVNIVLEPKIQ